MKFPMSHSRLNTFETCQLKFEYLYVDRAVSDEPNEYSEYGNRVHESLEQYGKTGDPKALTDETRKYRSLVDRIRGWGGKTFWEYQMAVREDHSPCGWFDDDVWLRSIADVLSVHGGKAYCLDWKTGKVKPNSIQLALFACMVFWHFPDVKVVHTSFLWLAHDCATTETFYREDVPQFWEPISTRLDKVQTAVELGVFDPKPSRLCKWCPAKRICAYA